MLEEYEKIKETTLEYLGRCIEAAYKMNCSDVAHQLERSVLEIRTMRFNIAVVGEANRGKSTLINTLLGRDNDDISPVGHDCGTGCIIHYVDISCLPEQDTPHAKVYTYGSTLPKRVDLSSIGDYIRESSSKDNRRDIARIEVYGSFPLLHSCCLVDTPGVEALKARHGELVYGFLPNADAVIMTFMASQPITVGDAYMVQHLSQGNQRRIFYLLTRIDEECPEDIPEIIDYIRQRIAGSGQQSPQAVYPVACKPVFVAQCNHSSQEEIANLRRKWGLARLVQDMEQLILESSVSYKSLAPRVGAAIRRFGSFIEQRCALNRELAKLHETDPGEMHRELERIRVEYAAFETKLSQYLDCFEQDWSRIAEAVARLFAEEVSRLRSKSGDKGEGDVKSIIATGLQSITGNGNPKEHAPGRQFVTDLESTLGKCQELIEQLDRDFRTATNEFLGTLEMGGLVSPSCSMAAASSISACVRAAWADEQIKAFADVAWLADTARPEVERGAGVAQGNILSNLLPPLIRIYGDSAFKKYIVPILCKQFGDPTATGVALAVSWVLPVICKQLDGPGKAVGIFENEARKLQDVISTTGNHVTKVIREKMSATKSDVGKQLAEIGHLVDTLDPAIRERALQHNLELDRLREEGNGICAALQNVQ